MKIVTLNLRHDRDRWEERFPLLVDVLDSEQPDVMAFQEVALYIDQAHMIAEELNRRSSACPYTVYLAPGKGDNPLLGIALLSRLLIQEHDYIDLPGQWRVAQRIVAVLDGKVVNIANTHLHHLPIYDEAIRLPQMRVVLEWMYAHDEHHWLLCGDMNAQPGSATILAVTERLHSIFPTLHGTQPVTFPTPLVSANYPPGLAVTPDHIFYDAATMTALSAEIIANQSHPDDSTLYPSDHFGLAAEVALR